METGRMTSRSNTGAGVALAALVGLAMWAAACAAIYAGVTP
jgi:hypothetical protein